MFCIACGKKAVDGAAFCWSCGTKLLQANDSQGSEEAGLVTGGVTEQRTTGSLITESMAESEPRVRYVTVPGWSVGTSLPGNMQVSIGGVEKQPEALSEVVKSAPADQHAANAPQAVEQVQPVRTEVQVVTQPEVVPDVVKADVKKSVVTVFNRLVTELLDLLVVSVFLFGLLKFSEIYVVRYPALWAVGFYYAYYLLVDLLFSGSSLGRWVGSLRLVSNNIHSGKVRFWQSVVRATFLLPSFLVCGITRGNGKWLCDYLSQTSVGTGVEDDDLEVVEGQFSSASNA